MKIRKNCIKNIKYINKNYINVFALASFLLAYVLFYLSLERCLEGEGACCLKLKWMKKKVMEESLSIILSLISFELIILNIISKFHIIHFVAAFILFYLYSHDITFDDHGYYNIKFFFIIFIPFLLILIITKYFISIKNKKIIFVFIFLFLHIFLNYLYKDIFNCRDWEKGLNNTSIDNNEKEHGCKIKIPKSCPYKIGKYFLDRFDKTSEMCYKRSLKSREIFLQSSKSPYINKNTYHIGIPILTNEEKLFHTENFRSTQRYISKHYIDMNNHTLINLLNGSKPEISFDFSRKNIGEIKVDLNFNQTLSDERKKLEKFVIPYSSNILVIFIDSVSRANSIRQLKQTLKFIEKFMSYKGNNNPKFSSENFHSFQFFKYHSHIGYTHGNYPLLFYGNQIENMNKKYITKYLKMNGYITAYSADYCFYDFVKSLYNFTSIDMYDHHYTICNPNFHFPSIDKVLECFYGTLYVDHMFEYMEQFWRKYKNNRKFSLFLTNFAHEGSLEILKYMDNSMYKYLNNLFKDNLLKDTSIFLLSDHGAGVPSIYYLMDFYEYEKHLPMFYLIVNDRKNQTYESQYEYLYKNQQSFITGYDIYNTIIHLIYGDKFGTNITNDIKSDKGESLFNIINSKIRSPKIYNPMYQYVCV